MEYRNPNTAKDYPHHSLDKDTIDLIRVTGDALAGRKFHPAQLNPWYSDDDQDHAKVSANQVVEAVDMLLELVTASRGQSGYERLRELLDYRVDRYAEGDVYINGLNHGLWLLIADMVMIRAFEVQHRQRTTLENYLTVAQAEREYNLPETTLRKAADQGRIPATKMGRDWLVLRSDVVAYLERVGR